MKKSTKITRRRQSVSTVGISENGCRSLAGSDNLHVDVSMSTSTVLTNDRQDRARNEKSRSVPTKLSKRVALIGVQTGRRTGASTSGIPEDAAVHFGKFYDSTSTKGRTCRDAGTTKSEFPSNEGPRTEFTRQMVHELERLAGTENYARQVSALLDSTIESPNFNVKPPPVEDFVPYHTSELSDYPLWYKEPDKMSSSIDVDSASPVNRTSKTNDGDSRVMNSPVTVASGIRRSSDVADYDNNDESSSISSSEISNVPNANTEDDSDYDEVNVPIFVK